MKSQKKSTFHHKTTISIVHSENLIQKWKIWYPDFFPDFPDPVFSRIFFLRGLAGGQTKCHFMSYINIFHILYEFIWWQKVADMKNAKNYFYLVSQYSKLLLNSKSLDLLIKGVKYNCNTLFSAALSAVSAVKWPHRVRKLQ